MHASVEEDQAAFVLDDEDADGDALDPLAAKEDPQQRMKPAALHMFDVNVAGASLERANPSNGRGSLTAVGRARGHGEPLPRRGRLVRSPCA